ncbi:MAG: hypothetical protein ACXW1W_06305 [Methylococcaceae bacterium]
MGLFDGVGLTIKQKARLNQPLPDVLSIYDIAELWTENLDDRKLYLEAIHLGFMVDWNDWKYQLMAFPIRNEMILHGNQGYIDIFISCLDFCNWLISYDEDLPKDCLLSNWWKDKSFDETYVAAEGARSQPQKPVNGADNQKRRTRNQQRDEDFKKYLEKKNEDAGFDIHTLKKREIQKELETRNSNLWSFDFNGWCKYTELYTGKPGRKKPS